jgi:hypothetical protein
MTEGDVGTGECAAQSGVLVSGKVVATDNGKPVAGAFVVVLRPGKKRSEVADDYSNLGELVATYAVTDEDGHWAAPCPIWKNKKHTVVVVADGFYELAADDVLDTKGAPDRFQPWGGIIRLQRR